MHSAGQKEQKTKRTQNSTTNQDDESSVRVGRGSRAENKKIPENTNDQDKSTTLPGVSSLGVGNPSQM